MYFDDTVSSVSYELISIRESLSFYKILHRCICLFIYFVLFIFVIISLHYFIHFMSSFAVAVS